MRILVALGALVLLSACVQPKASWDQIAYADPSYKPDYGAIKSLQSPGMY